MSDCFILRPASAPLLISVPHAGTKLPGHMEKRLSGAARALPDTDWFVERVWEPAREHGAGMVVARYSRYLIDVNRPPDDAALYAQGGTGLVPIETFAGEPLYQADQQPGAPELERRRERYWEPYHSALEAELARLRRQYGFAILLDAHSIRGEVPRLFSGRLPDLNLGTFDGASAAPALIQCAMDSLQDWPEYSHVLDGRFKGGYITRHYGRPERGCHALQMEMAQHLYMRESPPQTLAEGLERVQRFTRAFVKDLLEWRPAG